MFTSHVLCCCVLGFAAHSNISGDGSDCDYPSDMDPYDYLGYGTDFEECADEFFD